MIYSKMTLSNDLGIKWAQKLAHVGIRISPSPYQEQTHQPDCTRNQNRRLLIANLN